ncbi:MAG TPA: hypothetical protein VK796_02790, partial [Cytophaga sp.]|nr:hypothetical protein [Cytophaga sp.]
MIPDLVLPGNNPVELLPLSARNYRGPWLPGSTIYNESHIGIITIQESANPLFAIGYRLFQFLKKIKLLVNEKNKGICFEAILTGEYNRITLEGKKIKIKGGQYFISADAQFGAQFKKGINTSIFIIHYSQDLLEALGLNNDLLTPGPLLLNREMKDLIHDILNNPYEEKLRDFYYENTVREMLFLHLTTPKGILPGDLSKDDIAKIYTADSIMLEN